MKNSAIHIHNFRCFQEYGLNFAPDTAILIGKNGVGRFTLIAAIKRALSFVFSKDTSESSFSASEKDLKQGSFGLLDAYFDADQQYYCYPVEIECKAMIHQQELKWGLLKNTAGGKLLSTHYKKADTKFTELYLRENKLPVLLYLSDSYPHQATNIGSYAKAILKSGNPPPPQFRVLPMGCRNILH